jgi:hypothetical protein
MTRDDHSLSGQRITHKRRETEEEEEEEEEEEQ